MKLYYTNERNVLIVIALLKAHNIRKVIASPGSANATIVASLQRDAFFEIYSCVDERSAAYIACGLSAESGEPVVLTCTGATASRNYFPGLTEAYYRKLSILAITSSKDESLIGHLWDQVLDRSIQPKDAVKYSVYLQTIKDETDAWDCIIKTNKAILELTRHGGGPVHINLTTTYSRDYSIKELPNVRKINRIFFNGSFPELNQKKIAIYVGTHAKWTKTQTNAVDKFCSTHNAVVFCEPCSNYKGNYGVFYTLVANQPVIDENKCPDLLIHIGEVSAFIDSFSQTKEVWRVNEDGEIRDKLRKLTYIFEMPEQYFFEHYAEENCKVENSYFLNCRDSYERIMNAIPEIPFSNIWIASKLNKKLPVGSILHLGILSSLRASDLLRDTHNYSCK